MRTLNTKRRCDKQLVLLRAPSCTTSMQLLGLAGEERFPTRGAIDWANCHHYAVIVHSCR